jgi:hypothetical protein
MSSSSTATSVELTAAWKPVVFFWEAAKAEHTGGGGHGMELSCIFCIQRAFLYLA